MNSDATTPTPPGRGLQDLAELVELSRDALIVCDLDGRVRTWNAGAERLYGWRQTEVLGRLLSELVFQNRSHFKLAWSEVLEKGQCQSEMSQVGKDRRQLTVQCAWRLARDADGKPRAVLAANYDLTERQAMEEVLHRMQRFAVIGHLFGGIVHDLNNALTPVVMSGDMLRSRAFPEEKRLQLIERVERGGKRAAALLKELADFENDPENDNVRIRPRHLIREVVKLLEETFPKNIRLDPVLPAEVREIIGQPVQIQQVLVNLCLNARDAMPDGGTLTLSTTDAQVDKAQAAAHPGARPGPHVLIEVRDSGRGMSKEVLERLFEPFYAPNFFAGRASGRGAGLGLATTNSLVQKHGGFIEAESTAGAGSRFKVFLPAVERKDSPTQTAETELITGHGELILLVDDEEPVRLIATTVLERFGYRVVSAADGLEALSLVLRDRGEMAAAVIDAMMPRMDGLALVEELKSKVRPHLRILVMTGMLTDETETRFRRLGLSRFLRKPFTPAELLKALRDVIDGPSAPA